jgi:microcystin-dependent protein
MSDYTKSTDFAAKDSLPSGNAAKVIKGTEIDDEFNAIATAVATKADSTELLTAVPAGAVFHFAMTTAPTGYLICDGSAVSRSSYANLFAAIGTTFGAGDGSSTFNLPDLVGQFIRGYNSTSSGKDADRVFGSDQDDAIKKHQHYIGLNNSNAGADNNDGPSELQSGYWKFDLLGAGATQEGNCGNWVEANSSGGCFNMIIDDVRSETINTLGGSTEIDDNEIRPTNVALLACIKY